MYSSSNVLSHRRHCARHTGLLRLACLQALNATVTLFQLSARNPRFEALQQAGSAQQSQCAEQHRAALSHALPQFFPVRFPCSYASVAEHARRSATLHCRSTLAAYCCLLCKYAPR